MNTTLQPENDKWMVLCLSPVNDFRTSLENEIQKELQFHNVHSQTSHQQLPEPLLQSNDIHKRLMHLVQSLEEKNFSMLLISALNSTEETNVNAEGHFGEYTLYHYQTNLYALKDGESILELSMCLCIYDYQLSQISVANFARAIVWKMAEDQVIPLNIYEPIEYYTLLK